GQAHIQPTKNREHLLISNIGSSGEDGISMQVGDATFPSTAHPSIRMLHDDPPSTVSGRISFHPTVAREHLTMSNIGSSGDDGASLDLGDPADPSFTGPSLGFNKPQTGSSFLSFRPDDSAPLVTMQTFTTAEVAIMLNNAFPPVPDCSDCGPGVMLTAPAIGMPETSGSVEIFTGVDDGVTLYRGGRLTVSNIGSSGEVGVSLDLSNAANPLPVSRIQHRVFPDHRLTFKTSVMELDPELTGLLYVAGFDDVSRAVTITAKDGPDEIITELDPGDDRFSQFNIDVAQRVSTGTLSTTETFDHGLGSVKVEWGDGADQAFMEVDPGDHDMDWYDFQLVRFRNSNVVFDLELDNIDQRLREHYSDGVDQMECEYEPGTGIMSCQSFNERTYTSSGNMQCSCVHNDDPAARSVSHVTSDLNSAETSTCTITPGEQSLVYDNIGLRSYNHASQLRCETDSRGLAGQFVAEMYADNGTANVIRWTYDPNLGLVLGSGTPAPSATLDDGAGGDAHLVVTGDMHVDGQLSKSAGTFRIDHPLDPDNQYLQHSFVESPDMMNVYNGNIVTDSQGLATIQLPDYFEALNIDYKYQLTVIGQFAQAIIREKIRDNRFVIQTDKPGVEVSWQVTGVRNDAYAQSHRIQVEVDKGTQRGTRLFTQE
ncbi:MAG: hypothetical protein R3301_17940, partial [Saprospiraceae bacterium]|nr:hypothetical protein [Saprospiraceae bacterium]